MSRAVGRAHRAPSTRSKITRLVVLPLVLILGVGVTWAFWSTSSLPGGNGAAAATTLNQGATPTATALGNVVTVTWSATTTSNGDAVTGYVVRRYDAATLTRQTILSTCTGVVVTTTCTESGVPSGQWTYSVTPVLGTFWVGAESPKSPSVMVDGVPPENALSLSNVAGNAVLSGNTLYYRGVSAGSFTLTNAVTDVGSGPASSTMPVLTGTSTGWTHTRSTVSTPTGGPYVSTVFSWTAATTSAPTEVVTASDVAGNTTATTLSFVNDSTPPSASTITYIDGYQPGASVSVAFTTGTDAGSGIASRRLQRASAPITSGSCGTYRGFANLGVDGPSSPYSDTEVTNEVCYKYRYVVTDLLGNQAIATSANAAKVDYAGAVNATPGLLSQWRFGEPPDTLVSSDSFTGTSGSALSAHTGEIGAMWANPYGSVQLISSENRTYRSGTTYSVEYTTATPPSPNYSVAADLYYRGTLAGDSVGVFGRFDVSAATFYMARWESDSTWKITKVTSGGGETVLGSTAVQPALTVGRTYRIRLDLTGSTSTALKLSVNGVQLVSATDATGAFASAGKAGIVDGELSGSPNKTNTTGLHFDNFQVTPSSYPRAADSKGSNTADYENGPTQGVAGALADDPNTAASFDGVNDYVRAVGTTGIPVGASVRSVELWLQTTSSARQVLFEYGSLAAAQEYGLWLDPGATTMTAWGFGGTNDKVFAMPYALNDGAWHQVIETYNGTQLTVFIDGVALAAQTATRATVMDAYGFGIGAVVNPGDTYSGGFFDGALDEVSLYTTALSQATVTNHFDLATAAADTSGPTGGSIDAIGLVGTGSRYSTSTTLNLGLDKGTDPSGLAATGDTLLRATATLTSTRGTDGVCGTFGAYTLVTGGTDPSSPKSDVVTDQACFSYRYVVLDTLGNATTYTSPSIKVDATVPSMPALVFSVFSNTFSTGGSSPVVYYRSAAASGSFTVTASAVDASSGIASYAFPALGTNWTSTRGILGVNTYSWSGVPAVAGTKNVTATNNATGVSPNSAFALIADNTAPTLGTVTYPNSTQTATTVSVSFTTGTDAGSGIGTRLLQRASATLTGTTCGTFGGFATVTNGTNPSSPLVDTVAANTCYKYQYVVSDNVANLSTATSTNVLKVRLSYFDTIFGAAGLLSYWRLGEAGTLSDTFTGATGSELSSHTSDSGATWTRAPADSLTAVITSQGRIRKSNASGGVGYYSSAIPAGPDYQVEADLTAKSIADNDDLGIWGRVDLSDSSSSGTNYIVRYDTSAAQWELRKNVLGVGTALAAFPQTLTPNTTYHLVLDMNGSTIRMIIDGVVRGSVSDASIPNAGRAGIRLGAIGDNAPQSETQGMHLDNFAILPPLTDSKGTGAGDYFFRPTLGAVGAIAGDANTATQFDGVADYATVARQISDNFSIEFWFRSVQGIGTDPRWSQGAGLVDANVSGTSNDFGVSLRSDGRVVAGVGGGTPGDTSIVSTTGGYNNGSWHHVVFTRTRTTGAMQLYVDGATQGSATGSVLALTSPTSINFGRLASGTNYYAGYLDEIAVYSAAMSQATVTAHFAAAQ